MHPSPCRPGSTGGSTTGVVGVRNTCPPGPSLTLASQDMPAPALSHPPLAVIAPLTTLGHWQREVETWTDMNCVVYAGTAQDRAAIQVPRARASPSHSCTRACLPSTLLPAAFSALAGHAPRLSVCTLARRPTAGAALRLAEAPRACPLAMFRPTRTAEVRPVAPGRGPAAVAHRQAQRRAGRVRDGPHRQGPLPGRRPSLRHCAGLLAPPRPSHPAVLGSASRPDLPAHLLRLPRLSAATLPPPSQLLTG